MNVLWAVQVVIGMRIFNVFVAVLVYVVRVLILNLCCSFSEGAKFNGAVSALR